MAIFLLYDSFHPLFKLYCFRFGVPFGWTVVIETELCKCHNLSLLNVLNEMNPFSPKKPFSSGCQAKWQWPNSWRTSRFLHTGDYWSRTLGKLVFSEWCLQAYTQYSTIDRKKDFVHHNYHKPSFAGHCKPLCFSLVAGCFWTWCWMDWWHAWSC